MQALSGEVRKTQSLLEEYISTSDIIISIGDAQHKCDVYITEDAEDRGGEEDFSTACHEVPFGSFEAGEFILQQARYQNFSKTAKSNIRGFFVYLLF